MTFGLDDVGAHGAGDTPLGAELDEAATFRRADRLQRRK